MVLETDQSHGQRTPQGDNDHLNIRMVRRQQQREQWDAYFKVMNLETKGTILPRMKYYLHRFIDSQVSWFRESIAEPLQDRNALPYYHRKMSRVPEIDECSPMDLSCIWQANEQMRIDKSVDTMIVTILEEAVTNCMNINKNALWKCAKLLEDFEEADLNLFIKYGEMGTNQDARHCLMKQKHRLIWERRHPDIMAERERLYKEHKEKMAKGEYEAGFWRRNTYLTDKSYHAPYRYYLDSSPESHNPAQSKDPQFYKQASAAGKTGDEIDEHAKLRVAPFNPSPFVSGPQWKPEPSTVAAADKPPASEQNNNAAHTGHDDTPEV